MFLGTKAETGFRIRENIDECVYGEQYSDHNRVKPSMGRTKLDFRCVSREFSSRDRNREAAKACDRGLLG